MHSGFMMTSKDQHVMHRVTLDVIQPTTWNSIASACVLEGGGGDSNALFFIDSNAAHGLAALSPVQAPICDTSRSGAAQETKLREPVKSWAYSGMLPVHALGIFNIEFASDPDGDSPVDGRRL